MNVPLPILENKQLSCAAKGLLALLLRHPIGTRLSLDIIAGYSTDTLEETLGAADDLETCGYVITWFDREHQENCVEVTKKVAAL